MEQQRYVETGKGISQFVLTHQSWRNFTSPDYPIAGDGFVDLMVDHQGWIWASSMREGVSIWNGQIWRLLNGSISGLPMNNVERIVETEPGVYWLATALSTDVGGFLVRYDLQKWVSFTPDNSGYPGGEPLTILGGKAGQLLIGTHTNGLVVYQPHQ